MASEFLPLEGIGAVPVSEENPRPEETKLKTEDKRNNQAEGLGPRKATALYGNKQRKYELGSELKMSSGLRIDYVLVHAMHGDEDKQKQLEHKARERLGKGYHDDEDKVMSRTMKRLAFQDKLGELVDLEQEIGSQKNLVFTKVHCPFEVLMNQAEEVNLNLPLVEEEQQERQELISFGDQLKKVASNIMGFTRHFNFFDNGIPTEPDYYSAPFRKSKLHKYRNHDDENLFFTDAQRATLSHHLLSSIKYGPKPDQVGIRKLTHNDTYLDAYPLHDGPVPASDDPHDPENKTTRGLLYQHWARIRCFYKSQPVDLIRSYFGERVGIYFAWLGFYTKWLIVPSFVGFIVFLYGLGTFKQQQDAKELCDKSMPLRMCPLCDTCDPWILSDFCTPYEFSWVFDNGATIFFAIFMSVWASVFQDFWRRNNARLAYEWDVRNLTLEEPDRPQFKGLGDRMRTNPITGTKEKEYPNYLRMAKYGVNFSAVAMTLAVVILMTLSIIVYRLAVRLSLFQSSNTTVKAQSGIIAAVTAAILNLIGITVLNLLYTNIAVKLTDWENHRKDSKYESHLAFKIFVFSFVNNYCSLFYVAFFKGQFSGYPGHYNLFFGLRQDECPEYGCLLELTIQLAIIMVGKQFINNFTEFIVPRVQRFFERRKSKKEHIVLLPWESQYHLMQWPAMDLFYEYLEMIIQFGFITLFVAAFPLSPLFSLLNNILEIRIDADKMITGTRRPPAARAADIGIWEGVLEFVSFFSVITNGLVIAVTCSYITKLVYMYNYNADLSGYVNKTHPYFPSVNCSYGTLRDGDGSRGLFYYQVWASKLGFLIAFEHVVFLGKFVAQAIIPNVPKDIDLKIKREEYLASKALEERLDATETEQQAAAHNVQAKLQGASVASLA